MSAKDHEDVVSFLGLFNRLRYMIDDDLSDLEKMAADDEALKKLCLDVANVALSISLAERRRRELFAAPVDPTFVASWRDYEERYETALSGIMLADLIDMDLKELKRVDGPLEFKQRWKFAADEAHEEAHAIEEIFAISGDIAEVWSDSDLRDNAEKGTAEWKRLTDEAGFDLEGTFRRRKLIPFVLIPRHVSKHHGRGERLSLLTHLQQAQEAFVYGVPFAALALLRSLLELVLRIHYSAIGNDLAEQINSARLPQTVSKATLHQLRQMANDILHVDPDTARVPSSPEELEKEVLSFLLQLRLLIEFAPSQLPR